MAEESMTLLDVLRKEELPEGDFLREAVRHVVHELMEAEVTALVGAAQRASWAVVGHPRRYARAGHPEAADGQLFSQLAGAAAVVVAGAGRGGGRGVRQGGQHAQGRGAGAVLGYRRDE